MLKKIYRVNRLYLNWDVSKDDFIDFLKRHDIKIDNSEIYCDSGCEYMYMMGGLGNNSFEESQEKFKMFYSWLRCGKIIEKTSYDFDVIVVVKQKDDDMSEKIGNMIMDYTNIDEIDVEHI